MMCGARAFSLTFLPRPLDHLVVISLAWFTAWRGIVGWEKGGDGASCFLGLALTLPAFWQWWFQGNNSNHTGICLDYNIISIENRVAKVAPIAPNISALLPSIIFLYKLFYALIFFSICKKVINDIENFIFLNSLQCIVKNYLI
jgi:hypothetical protein